MEAGLFTANNVWMMICAGLVFFMHLGFSFLEIGLTRQKNTVNILFKNVFIICVGLLLYYIGGFNLMYPGFEDGDTGFLKFAGFGIGAPENGMTPAYADGGYTWWTDFLFQGMFAATAATIVSGAVAERVKLGGFMLFTLLYVGLVSSNFTYFPDIPVNISATKKGCERNFSIFLALSTVNLSSSESSSKPRIAIISCSSLYLCKVD